MLGQFCDSIFFSNVNAQKIMNSVISILLSFEFKTITFNLFDDFSISDSSGPKKRTSSTQTAMAMPQTWKIPGSSCEGMKPQSAKPPESQSDHNFGDFHIPQRNFSSLRHRSLESRPLESPNMAGRQADIFVQRCLNKGI